MERGLDCNERLVQRATRPPESPEWLLEAMHDSTGLDAAFGATRGFLSQVPRKISDMGEMEVGTAKGAMGVPIDDILCGAKGRWEGFSVVVHSFLIHLPFLQALEGRVVVARLVTKNLSVNGSRPEWTRFAEKALPTWPAPRLCAKNPERTHRSL